MKFEIEKREINGELVNAVLARDVWRALDSKQEYANWFKRRVDQSGFVEGEDYRLLDKLIKQNIDEELIEPGSGGSNRVDHAVSIDMAKHLGMMERNEKGKDVRQYFIDAEKKSRAIAIITHAEDGMGAMIRMADSLRVCESSKINMLTSVIEHYGLPTTMLPRYAVDQSSTSTAGSSQSTHSLTSLLKSHKTGLTARKANIILFDHGIIEQLSRPTSKGGSKNYWSFTDDGLEFGKNITSPSNQRETQPHFYDHMFAGLLIKIGR